MSEWRLDSPWFLLIGLVVLPIVWISWRARPTIAFSSTDVFNELQPTLRTRLASLPQVLMIVAILLFVIAVARPQTFDDTSNLSREGIAIMLVVDRSGSMNARDLEKDFKNVNRLEVVKDVLHYFLSGNDDRDSLDSLIQGKKRKFLDRGRPDDMIGLVAYAGFADSVCPLTLDHGNLMECVNELKLAEGDENGTAIGDGLGLAVERLRRSKVDSKVVILLTDGVNNRGHLEPLKAGDLAASENIKVYCIGAGTNGFAPVPIKHPLTGEVILQAMQVEIDEDTLKGIAEKTGGKYFRATDKEALKNIYDEIDELEKTEVSELQFVKYHEHFQSFLMAGALALVVSWMLQLTWLRRLPG